MAQAALQEKDAESVLFARYAAELAANHQDDQALALLNEGTGKYPAYAPGFLLLGEILSRRGETTQALEYLEKALTLDPQNPRLMFTLGREYLKTNANHAQELLWKARRYEPDDLMLAKVFHEAISLIDLTEPETEPENVFAQAGPEPDSGLTMDDWAGALAETNSTGQESVRESELWAESPAEAEPDRAANIVPPVPGIPELPESEPAPSEHLDNAIEELLSGVPDSEPHPGITENKPKFIISSPFGDEDSIDHPQAGEDAGSLELESLVETPSSPEQEEPTFALHVFRPDAPEPVDGHDIAGLIDEPDGSLLPETEIGEISDDSGESGMMEAGQFDDGYAALLEKTFPESAPEPPENDVMEIPEEELSGLMFDENAAELAGDSILTEQERAELAALSQGAGPEITGIDAPGREDEKSLYASAGELSAEEIESLSSITGSADDEQDGAGLHDGIDYSDVLYGHTPVGNEETFPDESDQERSDEFHELMTGTPRADDSEREKTFDEIPETPPVQGMIAADSVEESAENAESPVYDQAVRELMDAPETLSFDIGIGENRFDDPPEQAILLEELIGKSMSPDELISMEQTPLNLLIDDYVKALGQSEDIIPDKPAIPEKNDAPRLPRPAPQTTVPETDEGDASDFPIEHEEATATMAEIFLKQGMISRAIAIYRKLLQKQPGNETLQARLRELQQLHKTMSGTK